MTDKQIIIYKKECYNEPYCSLNQVLEQLKAKEQECEELKEYLAEESKLAHKVYQEEADTFFTLLKAEKQLDQLKAENEELQKIIDEAKNSNLDLKSFLVGEAIQNEYEQQLDQLKQTLTEIKPILELYANSKIGEEQPDGTYKLSGGIWDSFGFCATTYDPRPAREGLKKIREVEDV